MKKSLFPIFSMLIVLGFSCSVKAAQQDPLNAIAALNQALISIDRVEKNHSRQVVDEEYNFLNNNFKLADIPFTPEMQTLIEKMMGGYTDTKLEDEDRKLIRKRYEAQVNRAFLEVKPLSHIQTEAAVTGARSVLGSLDSNSGWFKNLLNAGFAGAMALGDYQIALQANERIRQQARGQEQEFMLDRMAGEWQLDKEFVKRLNDLKFALMNAQWAILTDNNITDDARFTQNNLDEFYTFISSKDPKAALRIGNGLKKLFGNYAPFWLHLGTFYMEDGDLKKARECFEKFEEVNRPIWRVDPYAAANARYKIFTLDENEKDEALRLVEIIENNSARDDWNNYLFAALQNYQLGNKDKAIQLLYHNIDLDYNRPLNEEILRQLQADKFDLNSVQGVAIREFRDPTQLEKLAKEGNAEAQFQLGEILGRNGNWPESRKWFEKSAHQGNLLAQARVFYLQNCWRKKDKPTRPFNKITEIENYNSEDSLLILGDFYQDGCGVKKDNEKAEEYFALVEKKSQNSYAQSSLASVALENKNFSKAFEWFKKAAQQGVPASQFMLGEMYNKGIGIEKNLNNAYEWYLKAAEQGIALAQHNLGIMYRSGEGISKDLTKAFYWYQKAAEQGHVGSQTFLADMFEKGEGVPKDLNKALSWYQKAAEKEDLLAQAKLGYMYEHGEGTAKDLNKAFGWYQKAAEKGFDPAQYVVGLFYMEGRGTSKDLNKAFEWIQKAAEQGAPQAQVLLGTMFAKGMGTTQNIYKAREWWQKAADQGNKVAKENLEATKNM